MAITICHDLTFIFTSNDSNNRCAKRLGAADADAESADAGKSENCAQRQSSTTVIAKMHIPAATRAIEKCTNDANA